MTRRIIWISMAAMLGLATASQPWTSGAAQAGPGPKPAVAAPCKDEAAALKVQLADAQAENARLQAQLDKLQSAERQRVAKLQAQLGAPMIEKLH